MESLSQGPSGEEHQTSGASSEEIESYIENESTWQKPEFVAPRLIKRGTLDEITRGGGFGGGPGGGTGLVFSP